MKLNVTFDEHRIYFKNEDGGFLGYTTFEADLIDKLLQVNWFVSDKDINEKNKTYIKTHSKKLGKYKALHQIVMIHWYGLERFEEVKEKGFIVEHHDNDAFNCLIENLSFASNDVNLAKAHTYDKERKISLPNVAINFFKDFKSKKYQITLGFNKEYFLSLAEDTKSLTSLKLLYEDDFRNVFNDASNLLYNLTEYKKFDLNKLQYIDYSYTETIYIQPDSDGTIPLFVEVDGKWAIVLSDKTKLYSVSPDPELYKDKSKD